MIYLFLREWIILPKTLFMKGMEKQHEAVDSDNLSDYKNMILDAMGGMVTTLILHSWYTLLDALRERLTLT